MITLSYFKNANTALEDDENFSHNQFLIPSRRRSSQFSSQSPNNRSWTVSYNAMPTPGEHLNTQQFLYEIPDDQSSALHSPRHAGMAVLTSKSPQKLERWNMVRSNGAQPKTSRKPAQQRSDKAKCPFLCVCLFLGLTAAMIVFGILLGSVIFYNLYGKCVEPPNVSRSMFQITYIGSVALG